MTPHRNTLLSDARISLPLLAAALATAVLLAAVAWRANESLTLEADRESLDRIFMLANELRYSSDALTRWSRNYVVRQNLRSRELFEELLRVREGELARPARTTPIIYWSLREYDDSQADTAGPRAPLLSLIKAEGATPEEISLLESAKSASDELVEIERAAMERARSDNPADQEAARQSLYDQRFKTAKAGIMTALGHFALARIDRSRQQELAHTAALRHADRVIGGAALVMLLSLVLTWAGFRRQVGSSVNTLATEILALAPRTSSQKEPVASLHTRSLITTVRNVAEALREKDTRLEHLVAELRSQEQRLRLLIEHAPVALALFDRHMRYVAYSERWVSAYHLEGYEILGHSHYDIFPEIPEYWRDAHRRGLAGERLRMEEDRVERADGSVTYLRWELAPWFTADGSIAGIAIMSEDITQSVTQRQELRGWSRAFESARIGVAFTDPTDPGMPRIVRCNPELERMLGQPTGALDGNEVMSLVPAELHEPMRSTLPALESEGHVRFESELLNRRGERIPVILDITNQPDTPEGRRRRIVFVLELAERNQLLAELSKNLESLRTANQELLLARDEAVAAQSTRNAILANLSHELRTPLNHVLGFSALLERASLPAGEHERIRKITAAGGQLLHLVNSLLDAVRTETGTLEIVTRDFALPDLFADLTGTIQSRLQARELQLLTYIDPTLPRKIHADPRRLAQVLSELLDNAIKFSNQSAIRLSARVAPSENGSQRMRVEVEDHGIGIDESQRSKLFGWFCQGDDSATRAYGGVGMGLVLAQRIVALMDGEIGYRATPGGGSTFWIEMPLVPAAEIPLAVTAETEAAALAARDWLQDWLPVLRAADMTAASAWAKRPMGVAQMLGDRTALIDTAMENFDFDIAAELVTDALTQRLNGANA